MSPLLPRNELSEFLRWYKRIAAGEKAKGNMLQHEGKRPVTLDAFQKLVTFSFSEWIRGIAIFDQYVTRNIMLASNESVNISCSVDV